MKLKTSLKLKTSDSPALLVPEGFDGIEVGGLPGGVGAEDDADDGANEEADDGPVPREDGRDAEEEAEEVAPDDAEGDADELMGITVRGVCEAGRNTTGVKLIEHARQAIAPAIQENQAE